MKPTQALNAVEQVVTYGGRDGDHLFSMEILPSEIPWEDPKFRGPAIQLMCKALLHLKGATKFKPLPNVVNAAELAALVMVSGDSGSSRFQVTDKDRNRAKDVLKGYEMAPEQTVAQFEEKYGIPFTTDFDTLAEHYKNVRAAASKPMGV